jgi:MYXO-CTERM domain-containing protein
MRCRLLSIVLTVLAVNAWAGPPDAWRNFNAVTNPAGRGCAGCHGSANIQSWSSELAGLTSSNFVSRLQVQGGAMATLANDNTQTGIDDRAAILQYLLDVRDGKVTGSLALGTVTIDSAAGNTGVVTIVNERSRDMTYSVPTFSATTGFSVQSHSCPTRTVPAAGSCNITIEFKPQSPPTETGPRSATMNLTLSGTGGDPNPGDKAVTLSGTGETSLEMTSGELGFTAAQPGTSAPQQVAIINRLNSNLRLCLVDLGSFPAPADFNLVGRTLDPGPGRCATLSTPGTTVAQDITFTPSASGPRFARLTVQRVGAGNALLEPLRVLDLKGNAGAFAHVNKTRLFTGASIDADGATTTEPVDLSSVGSASLTFTTTAPGGAFAITGGQAIADSCTATPAASTGEYQVMPGGCTALASLPAFAGPPAPACTLTVRFDPSGHGLRCGILTVSTNGGSHTVVLEGSGFFGPRLAVRDGTADRPSPHSLDFTSQLLTGVSYPAKSLFMRNAGTLGNLELVLPPEAAASGFAVRPGAGCASSMAPFDGTGPECQVDIFFLPTEMRSYTGSIDILARPAGSGGLFTTYRVNLTGIGSNVAPELRWSSDRNSAAAAIGALDFGSVASGIDPLPVARTVFLHNIGNGSARIDLLHAVGAEATSYRASLVGCTAGGFLPQGQSCEVRVEFLPATAGTKQAELRAVSTGNGPLGLPLRGSFSAASLSPRLDVAAAASFDATRVGSRSNPVEVLLSNTSGFPVQVTGMAVSGPFAIVSSSCSAVPFALPPSSGCRVSLAFQPTAEGAASGTLEVTTDVSATPVSTALSGQGEAAANLSSGGCSIASGESPADPTLWLLVAIAAAVMLARRREQLHRKR